MQWNWLCGRNCYQNDGRFGKSPSTCVWLRSEGSVELCGLWISLPLGSSDDFCGQWGWAATWGQVSPFSSLLLLPGAGSKSRCVESEEHQPSPRAVIEPTDWTWQADSSSEFFLFFYLMTKMETMVELDTKLRKYYTRIPPVWVPVGLRRARIRWLFMLCQIWHSQSSICFESRK